LARSAVPTATDFTLVSLLLKLIVSAFIIAAALAVYGLIVVGLLVVVAPNNTR
jgi:hypothetical protein